MGIPPDPYPEGRSVITYAGSTRFDKQLGGDNVRYAEIRGHEGESVVGVQINVIAPPGKPIVPLMGIQFGIVNVGEPQIVASIQTPDGSAIADGYVCQFVFQAARRSQERLSS